MAAILEVFWIGFFLSAILQAGGVPRGLYNNLDPAADLLKKHLPYSIDMSHSPLKCDRILVNRAYLSCYNYQTNTSLWSSYTITQEEASQQGKRFSRFLYDNRLPKRHRIKPTDYAGSRLDRGHLMPNALVDGSDPVRQGQTFLMSNIAPQNPKLNREGWAALERAVRKWLQRHKKLNVITGVWFDSSSPPLYIGRRKQQKIAVPTWWYKIILDPAEGKSMAFWMPNKPISKRDWFRYRTSIEAIEHKTGILFYPSYTHEGFDPKDSSSRF